MELKSGFFIVKNTLKNDSGFSFLWVARKKDGFYYQLNNSLPQKLERACENDLEHFEVVEEMRISRKEMVFDGIKITVNTKFKGRDFEFRTRSIEGLVSILELFPKLTKKQ
jgi:hypothetical protein